jgi:hypothetical protein
MRVVHLTQDMEAIARRVAPAEALKAARDRRDQTYDPELADLFVAHGRTWFDALDKLDPWHAVLDREPEPHRILEGAELDEALTVAADFIDLKSPYRVGHSRRCAQLAADAASLLGVGDAEIAAVRRAALLHEFGTTAVPNSIWDKRGPLTRAEFDRVELHPMLSEQMLRRSPALAALIPVAAAHHEKADGSGYHRGLHGDATERGARILCATDIYVGLTTERADRPAFTGGHAATEVRRLASMGVLEHQTTEAVLTAAGHSAPRPPLGVPGRAQSPRGRGAAAGGAGTHDPGDRRPALHLTEDRRPPHPARLRQDRCLDACRRRPVGDATRRHPLIPI